MSISWVKKVLTSIDYVRGRYQCVIAQEEQIAECLAIRKQVFGDELNRNLEHMDTNPADEDEIDQVSQHFACIDNDTGQIVGTLRHTFSNHVWNDTKYAQEYRFHLLPENLNSQISILSRLAILPDYRKSAAIYELILGIYRQGIETYDSELALCVCEPQLFPMYRRLGFRPLDKIFISPFGGYRLPLFLASKDYDYFKQIGSPYYKIANQLNFPKGDAGLRWMYEFALDSQLVAPGFTVIPDQDNLDFHSCILKNLNSESQKSLLKKAIHIECELGDVVIAKGTGGRNLGFVKTGALEVRSHGKLITVLGEGDVFGEIAFILDIPRTADLVAVVPQTEVVLLRFSSVEQLKNEKDKTQIWRNLSELLSKRLIGKKDL